MNEAISCSIKNFLLKMNFLLKLVLKNVIKYKNTGVFVGREFLDFFR